MSTVKATTGIGTRSQTGVKAQAIVANAGVASDPAPVSTRRYSDVVASRLPTPIKGEGAEYLDRNPDSKPKSQGVLKKTPLSSSDEESEPLPAKSGRQPQDGEGLWTTVQRRRARSLDTVIHKEHGPSPRENRAIPAYRFHFLTTVMLIIFLCFGTLNNDPIFWVRVYIRYNI